MKIQGVMKQGSNSRRGRPRNNNNGKRHSNNRNQTFDSNGPDGKVRGTAQQVYDKYLSLAREAASNGDRVKAESCFQHAEHYFRIVSSFGAAPKDQARAKADAETASAEATVAESAASAEAAAEDNNEGAEVIPMAPEDFSENEEAAAEPVEAASDEDGDDEQERRPRRRLNRLGTRGRGRTRRRASDDDGDSADDGAEAASI